MNRIKLLEFVTSFDVGGTERHVVNLIKHLDRDAFELHVCCLKRRGKLLRQVETNGISLSEYNIDSLYNFNTLKQQFHFARYLREHKIEIVHAHGFYSNTFALPVAWLARTPVMMASIRDMGDIWTARQRHVQKFPCRFADRIVVNAAAIKQRLIEEGYDSEKLVVIRNGISVPPCSSVKGFSGLRRELGIGSDAPLVLLVSRLNPIKGIPDFIEAAVSVRQQVPEAYFVIVGDTGSWSPGYRKELEQHAASYGLSDHVIFTGLRLDLPALYAEASMLVLPSLSEGLSNVLLEAMAAGLPIVATRVGGNPEVVKNGITGLLVPPRDPLALAGAMTRMLKDRGLARRFGHAGYERVRKHFSLERMVRQSENLYRTLLEAKTGMTPRPLKARTPQQARPREERRIAP